jgi:hypothetical protein
LLPCATPPGATSNVNVDAPGQTRAVAATVVFDPAGSACVFNQEPTDIVVDIQGYYAPGVLDDIADERILDTRIGR